jgi:hypothetical protein
MWVTRKAAQLRAEFVSGRLARGDRVPSITMVSAEMIRCTETRREDRP